MSRKFRSRIICYRIGATIRIVDNEWMLRIDEFVRDDMSTTHDRRQQSYNHDEGRKMKRNAPGILTFVSTAAVALLGTAYAQAQDLVLEVKATEGTSSPVSGQHTVAAGNEVAIHAGPAYRVVVVPTLLDSGQVQLAMKVFDSPSSTTPVSAPMMVVGQGQEATVGFGSDTPSAANLKIQVTPRLK